MTTFCLQIKEICQIFQVVLQLTPYSVSYDPINKEVKLAFKWRKHYTHINTLLHKCTQLDFKRARGKSILTTGAMSRQLRLGPRNTIRKYFYSSIPIEPNISTQKSHETRISGRRNSRSTKFATLAYNTPIKTMSRQA